MPQELNSLTYRSGANEETTFARAKPTFINAAVLEASVEKQIAVPEGAGSCVFSADGDFFARPDATASVPSEDITDGSGSELNPAQWDVHDVAILRLIAPEATIVTLSFYK